MAREAPTPSTLGASPLDLTSRYDAAAYRRGPRERWMLDRVREPVRALVLHHAGGVLRSGPTVRLRDAWRERSARL